MMHFLEKPHIPQSDVCLCAIGAGQPYIKSALEQCGIQVVQIPASGVLPTAIAGHADMLLHHQGGETVLLAEENACLRGKLESCGLQVEILNQPLRAEYPGDVALNCFVLKKFLFCRWGSIAKQLLKYYQYIGNRVVHVNQGYAKCAATIVNENSIITADAALAEAGKRCGLQVLRIRAGDIALPGYDYGFIGGCCGLLGPRTLAFCGDIDTHMDAADIRRFCSQRGVEIVTLCTGVLRDIGGILPLGEVD